MIEIIGYALIFIAGAFIGSFLNVVADRLPAGESPFKGRSRCDVCKTTLGPVDLVPVLSYLILKARCRYCNVKLSPGYPISEILTGLVFTGLAFYMQVFSTPNYMVWVSFAYLAIVASMFIVILFADLRFKIIPNKVVFPAIILVFSVMVLTFVLVSVSTYLQLNADPFGKYLLEVGYLRQQVVTMLINFGITIGSAFGIGLFFWFLIVITRGKGMGGGDVKLAFLIGLFNGFPYNLIAIVIAFVSGALISVVLMLLRRKGMKDVIPFGPFLILGSAVAFVYGQQLFDWYVGLL